jgi:beta-glucosidase-like glycosyl hydrolase
MTPGRALPCYVVLALLCIVSNFCCLNAAGNPNDNIYNCGGGKPYPFCNYSLPIHDRVKDLVSRLTSQEKILQMIDSAAAIPRLGITSYNYWSECLHGVLAKGTTSFPQVIGLGAAFNMTFVRRMTEVIATEGRALFNSGQYPSIRGGIGGLTYWSPNINIFRDPRWGRGQETPGEDPFLTSQYAIAFATGLQEGEDPRYKKVLSTCKHYDAYDLENWHGMDRYHFNAIVNDRDLVETFLPPFEACVREGNVGSVMCSYNSINGIPACADDFLLNEIMRNQWGFDGYIVSDCDAVDCIFSTHHYTNSTEETCKVAIEGGCDLNCGSTYAKCGSALSKGYITNADLDRAVYRMFKQRFELGMFDPASIQPYTTIGPQHINTPYAQELALDGARQTMTLLQNNGDLLPLSPITDVVAVIGPNADDAGVLIGNYAGTPPFIVTILDGIRNRISTGSTVLYAKGCNLTSNSTEYFPAALTAAGKADVVIMVVGLNQDVESEGHDRDYLTLPGVQLQLIQQVFAINSRMVVVFVCGGPVSEPWIKDNVPAIVQAYYPGEQGGLGVADVLFGYYNPGGRLPYTVYPPQYVDQLSMENMDMTAPPGRTYKYYTGKPLWEFGHGLSYTKFRYQLELISEPHRQLKGQSPKFRIHSALDVSYRINVTNVGDMAGSDVVLGFIHFPNNKDAPIKQLFGFERVFLQPGEMTQVFFSSSALALSLVDGLGDRHLHPGTYKITVGEESVQIELVGEKLLLKPWRHTLRKQLQK